MAKPKANMRLWKSMEDTIKVSWNYEKRKNTKTKKRKQISIYIEREKSTQENNNNNQNKQNNKKWTTKNVKWYTIQLLCSTE